MRLRDAIKILQTHTLASHWPDQAMGQKGVDIAGITNEVRELLRDIRQRQDIPRDAMFYVLDSDNPETLLHDQLVQALITVKQAIQNTYPA